jgi:hypothetical protein
MDKQVIITDNELSIQHVMRTVDTSYQTYRVQIELVKDKDLRSTTQNSAMHVYFTLLAKELNDAGLDVKTVLESKSVGIDWTPESVKELLWRPLQKAVTGKESSAKILVDDVSKIFKHLSGHLLHLFGIFVPFPKKKDKNE